MAQVHGLFTDLAKFVDFRTRVIRHSTRRFPILDIKGKKSIAIHHSLTRRGLGGSNAIGYSRFHVETNGWPSIGYSYVIEPDGEIRFCNPINWRTYHVGNSNNEAVGICLTGDFRFEEPTDAQKKSLVRLVERLQKDYPQLRTVRSHDEYPGYAWKQCCEFDYKGVLSNTHIDPTPVNPSGTYVIQEGDTFWSLAKGRDFTVVDLEKANPGVNPTNLQIGQTIKFPTKDEEKATPEDKSSPAYHGNSIQKYLESIGEDGSYSNRVQIARRLGIQPYSGTAEQNIRMLNILRDGAKAPVVSNPPKPAPTRVAVGDYVTVPANKLYGTGNSVSPVSNRSLSARVERINNNWLNPLRLQNANGVYVGFARVADVTKGSTAVDFRKGDKVTASRLYGTSVATSPARTTPIDGYIDIIQSGWRNPYRLTRTKGGTDYIGFARRSDLRK